MSEIVKKEVEMRTENIVIFATQGFMWYRFKIKYSASLVSSQKGL